MWPQAAAVSTTTRPAGVRVLSIHRSTLDQGPSARNSPPADPCLGYGRSVAKGTAKRGVKGEKAKAEEATPPTGAPPRLPAGRHGLPREFITQNQRERIITALVDTVAERGYNATTVANITKAASVSRRTFYEHFSDKEACFLAAYDMVADPIRASMRAAAESFSDLPQQVRAA